MRIGYSDNTGLARAIRRAGHDLGLAQAAGLLHPDRPDEFMRGRLVFPVFAPADRPGPAQPVYLIGRGMQTWQAGTRYLGLPQHVLR